jgi:hypothetical protein
MEETKMHPMSKLLVTPRTAALARAGYNAEATCGELRKPRRMVEPPSSQARSYHGKRRCLNRLVGATLGALLLLPVFSGPAFATHQSFGPSRDWTGGPYYGQAMTVFADVTGDGKADAIALNWDTVTVRRSDGCRFGPNEDWTGGPYSGEMWTYFADVTGDGKADAIALNTNTVMVRRSDGTRFKPAENWTGAGPILGQWGSDFVDVTGDKRADALLLNPDSLWMVRQVIPSTYGSYFGTAQTWTGGEPITYGEWGTFFADVTGDRKADAIIVNEDKIRVRESNGFGFATTARGWTADPYYGELGTYFADVTGDGKADAIVVNYDTVAVRRSMFPDPLGAQELERACYGN